MCRCGLLNNRKISKCRIADFTAMPHSFSTTLQPLTPASSQQQRWSFQCHVYSERVLLHLAGQFNALSLMKKVSKGDRPLIGGSRLYVFFTRCFTSLPPSTSIQMTQGDVWREGTENARTNFASDAFLNFLVGRNYWCNHSKNVLPTARGYFVCATVNDLSNFALCLSCTR